MLQRDSPDDYVVATGETHSVREMVELAFSEIGMEIMWVMSSLSVHSNTMLLCDLGSPSNLWLRYLHE